MLMPLARVAALSLLLGALVLGQTSADKELERRVLERIARSKLAADAIKVRAAGGVVTLEGETAVPQRKGVATRLARAAGAARVDNRIRVRPAQTPGGEPRRFQPR
jgi:osmotically-inducible protein OsmY